MQTTDQIFAGMPHVIASPTDGGRLEAIVVRPSHGARESRESVYISPEGGVEGDRWLTTCSRKLADGSSDPSVQVSLMNARILRLISGEAKQMLLAGDNLIVDLDLSEGNITAGQRLSVGEAVLEITDVAHNGCGKFLKRYGREVVKFVNSPEGKRLHLRGLFARVVRAGAVSVGDEVRKV